MLVWIMLVLAYVFTSIKYKKFKINNNKYKYGVENGFKGHNTLIIMSSF